jgi:hypothetical protein
VASPEEVLSLEVIIHSRVVLLVVGFLRKIFFGHFSEEELLVLLLGFPDLISTLLLLKNFSRELPMHVLHLIPQVFTTKVVIS